MRQAAAEDVVHFEAEGGDRIGQIKFHVSVSGQCFSCVEIWKTLGNNRFDFNDPDCVMIESSSIREVYPYTVQGSQAVVAP